MPKASTRYEYGPGRRTEPALPSKADDESGNLAQCRDLVENGTEVAFDAWGYGLLLRDVENGGELDVVWAPESIAELDWVADHHRRVELQGSLGGYLFLRALGWEAPCGQRGDDLNDFIVYDLGRREVVTDALVARWVFELCWKNRAKPSTVWETRCSVMCRRKPRCTPASTMASMRA